MDYRDSSWEAAVTLIKADLRRRLELEGRPMTRSNACRLMVTRGGFRVVTYRVSTWLVQNRHPVLSRVLDGLAFKYTGMEIHVGSKIGEGLVLADQRGIGIPKFATIGRNCTILGASSITLGGVENIDLSRARIVLGDHCIIGVGARILGAVTLGDSTQIKTNSVVLVSSPLPGSILTGIAARRRGTVPPELVANWNPLKSRPLRHASHVSPGGGGSHPERKEETHLNVAAVPGAEAQAPSRQDSMKATPNRQSWSQTLKLVRSDFEFRCAYEKKQMTRMTAARMLMHPGVGSAVRYRFQCFFIANGLSWLGYVLKHMNLILYGIDIDEHARIGGGLCISHAVSIVIAADVIIGERCVLFHQNTIGPSPFCEPGLESGPVIIGNDVTFGGGSSAHGNIIVGDKCRIGPNAVVDRSFPAGSVLFGAPARLIGKTEAAKEGGL